MADFVVGTRCRGRKMAAMTDAVAGADELGVDSETLPVEQNVV